MGAIYLVRHGQASFGAKEYDQLSQTGEEQARRLGEWINHCAIDVSVIATGTQKRHKQSAIACSSACPGAKGANWHEDAGFNEFDHHEVLIRHRREFASHEFLTEFLAGNGNPRRAFQQIFAEAVARWISGRHDDDYAESFAAFRKRVTTALEQLIACSGAEKTSWIFTSGGAISAVVQELLGIPDERIFDLNWTLVNTGVTKLLHRPGKISLSYVNGQAHLERLQKPELITYR